MAGVQGLGPAVGMIRVHSGNAEAFQVCVCPCSQEVGMAELRRAQVLIRAHWDHGPLEILQVHLLAACGGTPGCWRV